MAHGDGSMTFDWIFFAIVAIPMVFAAWELFKTPKRPLVEREIAAGPRPRGPVMRRTTPDGPSRQALQRADPEQQRQADGQHQEGRRQLERAHRERPPAGVGADEAKRHAPGQHGGGG